MNKIFKSISLATLCVMGGVALQSCSLDDPFLTEGEGTLQMKLVINSDVTRAETDPADLAANCVVYISNTKGLIYKYQGIENVPESLSLKNGHYVAEAWTGDSVPASFDSKFFRGYQPFDINGGLENVVLKCRIANVVVSVNTNTVDMSMMKDWNINVKHSRGALDFTEENMDYAKGYFMMPNADKDLEVTITGKNAEGNEFTKTQTIENVERAHEYVLNFAYNPDVTDPTDGGAFITLIVDDREVLIEDQVEIYSAPVVVGVDFDVTRQIVGDPGAFTDKFIKINAYGGLEHVYLSSDDHDLISLTSDRIDLSNATEQIKSELASRGLVWDVVNKEDRNLVCGYLNLSAKWLNALPARDTEYILNMRVIDKYGKSAEQPIRIAVGEAAVVIDDPVTASPVPADNYMAILTNRATLSGTIVNPEATNPGIRYREAEGNGEWTFVPAGAQAQSMARRAFRSAAQAVRSGGETFNVTLTGLKPSTRYEYQAVADGFNSTSLYFTTEGKFAIPNASLEEWSNYSANSKVLLPGAGGERTFWDSGNHGSATMSTTLTQGSTDMFHSGAQSARLRSQFVGVGALGKFAAGNLFAGEYYKTNGTNGEIYFGREYDGSHPSKLKVFVNYRPAAADKNGSKNGKLKQGDLDKGQIYVALTTEKVHIDTRYPDTSLWNTDADCVLAYGEKIFNENYGPDGGLQELQIPLEYKAKAAKNKPLYLVIVCTASYYGDYFDGGEGSCMYVDDFELLYE